MQDIVLDLMLLIRDADEALSYEFNEINTDEIDELIETYRKTGVVEFKGGFQATLNRIKASEVKT